MPLSQLTNQKPNVKDNYKDNDNDEDKTMKGKQTCFTEGGNWPISCSYCFACFYAMIQLTNQPKDNDKDKDNYNDKDNDNDKDKDKTTQKLAKKNMFHRGGKLANFLFSY